MFSFCGDSFEPKDAHTQSRPHDGHTKHTFRFVHHTLEPLRLAIVPDFRISSYTTSCGSPVRIVVKGGRHKRSVCHRPALPRTREHVIHCPNFFSPGESFPPIRFPPCIRAPAK